VEGQDCDSYKAQPTTISYEHPDLAPQTLVSRSNQRQYFWSTYLFDGKNHVYDTTVDPDVLGNKV
jgi:hypothetical protein